MVRPISPLPIGLPIAALPNLALIALLPASAIPSR
jgi:hypothetical protein